MKASELKALREKTRDELNEELNELKAELFKLRFQHATSQLENPMKLRQIKKDIARVQTIIREKELGIRKA
ncbi:MAG TPA: 50S ribosomal protein L29 [Thermoclostridium caenicola]|uniref:Large ribosomal subunit protein uL29 n=1 Tax=Thermoclostridium caenicola TaxID=659425 RepID=A0A1M6F759_9FIRM|nr:50S ribosomal protein L29 [Thermoclostridium caenicola]SHI93513.1 LSU ribosomal protein L29P [Thermoclostridium caenicola]HOK42151.1 50S ribosomal protein L29 [Thermoclostridium caenicola]HOL83952.1 50S ribosomal protein L29 [Thermoclostridium caenicola]HOP72082.1 50S ribosomal protein L29 [Thermoclostridium caenicola]HPO75561.1 50S ribosomal protein L29 [Thermoclostridium caenicola]